MTTQPSLTERIIQFFADRHILSNLLLVATLLGGVLAWQNTKKEELPAVTFDTVRISVIYRGAPAADVEYFVTKPIEEELRDIDGVYRVTSSSSTGQSNINVELERGYPNIDEAILEIRSAVLDVELPADVIDEPMVRVFKTTKKAVLDIALYKEGTFLLDVESRALLQRYALTLENQLLSLPQVHSVTRRGYLPEEIQIKLDPKRMAKHEISFNAVINEIRNNHVRSPAGTLESAQKEKVTLLSELNTPERIRSVAVQAGFQGKAISLSDVADVDRGYDDSEPIHKVNGHEAVMFNIVKNSSFGILETLDVSRKVAENFKKSVLRNSPVTLVLLDDESVDVRNRLNLVGVNGAIGFVLILVILFVFLDWRSGLWVAVGIPFTLCFTMIACSLMGYTINGTTLSAVIIVMGIVVDDAIIVAENITRYVQEGLSRQLAVVQGTAYVIVPVFASIITTCAAFIPLLFFEGHFGAFVSFIPPVIVFMLLASLIESILILPGHMGLGGSRAQHTEYTAAHRKRHWFEYIEMLYSWCLQRVLPLRSLVVLAFLGILFVAWQLVTEDMKFAMFPNEETRDLVLTGETAPESTRLQTALQLQAIEDIIVPYVGKEVVGFRSEVARSRRGGAAAENSFRTIIEIVDTAERTKTADEIVAELEAKISKLEGFSKLYFAKTRWGNESGSPIEIIVQDNNDQIRQSVAHALAKALREHPAIANAQVDDGYQIQEYQIDINREVIKRLGIDPRDIVSTFRAALEGTVLYEFSNGDEDVNVRLTTVNEAKRNIESVLSIPVENRNNYLVTLESLVHVKKVTAPSSISRQDLKRSTILDADLEQDSGVTPLEIASEIEEQIFPAVLENYPTTTLKFDGEIKNTRESTDDFKKAILMVLVLIYGILAVLFNSLLRPFMIMFAIPFGVVGVILAFYAHGKLIYGFYACVGVLGMAGVVINDAIVMLVKLDRSFDFNAARATAFRQIADIAASRLRAVLLTTVTTVVGVLPTAYGFAGYDATLAEMMLALTWGLIFGTTITLLLIPCLYSYGTSIRYRLGK